MNLYGCFFMRAGARSGALRGGKGSGNMDGCVAGRGGFPASFAVLRRKIFLPRRAPIRKRRLVSCPDFLRMSSDADGSRRSRVGTAFLAAAGNGGGTFNALRSPAAFIFRVQLVRASEAARTLRVSSGGRAAQGGRMGRCPYPARELSSLDLPLFQPLRKKETAPFCSRRVPVLPRSSGVFNSSCISFAVISGPPCFAAQSFHTFSPQPSFQREQ